MILSNVNIGTGPSSGDGDPLRSAFSTINTNFQYIVNNVNTLTNSVTSVAGRTGNIVLTVNDVIGAASVAYVNSQFANAGSYSNINVTAFLPSYAGSIATVTQANLAMKGYVDASVAGLIDSAPGTLDTLNELAAALGDDPNLSVTLTNTISSANIAMKAYVDGQVSAANTLAYSNVNTLSYLTTNSYSTQAYVNLANVTLKSYVDGQISAANSAVTAANLGMKGYVDSVAGQSTYGNADVASYLTVYGGNVRAANIIFDDLSIQTTAYTGTQWRSNLESNVTVKPSWLSYVPGGKNQEGTQYGFDAGGMFFTSNADNDFAYPIQTNLHFHQDDVLEIIATFHYTATNNDHGLCIFSTETRPIWRNGIDGSRIAFQYNTGIPLLYGQTTANTAPGSPVLSADNYYTIKFIYDPTNTVTVETFSGNTATGSAIDTRTISEVLPAGDYKLGFDADNDSIGVKSYWTNVTVRTLTNTVVNDLEVQGQVIGDLIPSANVTYSLGNVTHQWRDIYVSSNTIYLGGTALSVASGNLTVNGNAVVSIGSDSLLSIPTAAIFNENVYGGTNNRLYLAGENSEGSPSIYIPNIADGAIYPITIQNPAGSNVEIITQSGTWSFDANGVLTLPGEGVLQSLDDTVTLVSLNTTSGYANSVYLGSGGGLGFSDQSAGGNWLEIFRSGATPEITSPTGNLKITTVVTGVSSNTWTYGTDGSITFPDNTVQTTAWTGDTYSNVQVATYLIDNGYTNTVNTAAISGNVLTLDFSLSTQIVTHDANISNVAIANGPGNLTTKSMTVVLSQDAIGGKTISGYYKTQDGLGLDIDTTELAVNIYTFLAVNNGSTTELYAFSNGTNFI